MQESESDRMDSVPGGLMLQVNVSVVIYKETQDELCESMQ
jgi:hypothetical protein